MVVTFSVDIGVDINTLICDHKRAWFRSFKQVGVIAALAQLHDQVLGGEDIM